MESQLNAVQAKYLGDPDFEFVMEDASTFAEGSSRVPPMNKAFIDAWVKLRPDSPWAHYSEGLYWSTKAGDDRGDGWASNVSDAQWDKMRADDVQARKQLRKALELNPKLLMAWLTLMDVDRADPDGGIEDVAQDYKDASAQFPGSLLVADDYMISLQPRWGGSIEKMAEFANAKISDIDKNPRFWGLQGDAAADAGCLDCIDVRWEDGLKLHNVALTFEDRPSWLAQAGDAALHLYRFGLAHEYYARANSYKPGNITWATATSFLEELCDPKASPARLKRDRKDAVTRRGMPDIDYFQQPRDCGFSATELPWGDEPVPTSAGLQSYAIGGRAPLLGTPAPPGHFPFITELKSPDTRYILRNHKVSTHYVFQLEDTLTGHKRVLLSYSTGADVTWSEDSTRLSMNLDVPDPKTGLTRSGCLIFNAGKDGSPVDVRQNFDKRLSGFEPSQGMEMFLSCADWWDQNIARVSVVLWNLKTNKMASQKIYHYSLARGTIEEEKPAGH